MEAQTIKKSKRSLRNQATVTDPPLGITLRERAPPPGKLEQETDHQNYETGIDTEGGDHPPDEDDDTNADNDSEETNADGDDHESNTMDEYGQNNTMNEDDDNEANAEEDHEHITADGDEEHDTEANDEDDVSTDFEEDDDIEWPASTVMYVPKFVDEKLIAYFQKYITKESNKDRIFKPSMTVAMNDTENDDPEELEESVDETFRKCKVARDTHTLQKLYNMMGDDIDTAADKFIEKFNFFNIVSTKEDYTMLRFEPGDFYKEHIECSGLNDDTDGSSRKICVYLILEAPQKGGIFEFSYQGTKIRPETGSMLMFPSCPLHPLRITKIQRGNLMYITNFLL